MWSTALMEVRTQQQGHWKKEDWKCLKSIGNCRVEWTDKNEISRGFGKNERKAKFMKKQLIREKQTCSVYLEI